MPKCSNTKLDWTHLKGFPLADPNFSSDEPIEFLLGVDVFQLIVQNGIAKSLSVGPVGQNTSLGWILSYTDSPINFSATSQHTSMISNLDHSRENQLNHILQRFREIESIPMPSPSSLMSIEDLKCDKIFQETFSRDESGRFTVRLPFKSSDTSFTGNFAIAKQVLLRTEKRFRYNHAFMQEYIDLALILFRIMGFFKVILLIPNSELSSMLPLVH